MSLSQWILTFTLFSTIGWMVESLWCWAGTRKLVNRGFLSGPWCPIYGFGSIIILSISEPYKSNWGLVFLSTLISTSLLEYITGWLMETLFKARWWDYSKRFMNLKGRICLRNSLLFGLLGLVVVYGASPITEDVLSHIPHTIQTILALCLVLALLMDTLFSLNAALKVDKRIEAYRETAVQLNGLQDQFHWFDIEHIGESIERLRTISQGQPDDAFLRSVVTRIDELSNNRIVVRFFKAFPILENIHFYNGLESILDDLLNIKKPKKKQPKERN